MNAMDLIRGFVFTWVIATGAARAEGLEGISYYPADRAPDDPDGRCAVDVRIPEGGREFATLVWFHGGGLTGGQRDFPEFAGKDVALVAAGYRLSPQVACPVIIEDAAAAVAWTLGNIAAHGGDPERVFVGGHSAGGYLALMVGMDPRWLKPHGLTPAALAGLLPVSTQVTTHFHVKEARGDKRPGLVPVIDDFAPLHFVAKDLPPICLITGDRRIEWPCRVEENELFSATLKKLADLDHGTVTKGAAAVMPGFIRRILEASEDATGAPEADGEKETADGRD